ncbi:MAG: glycosyltransferase family 4 protein [Chloroflexota bacterium]
MSGVVMLVNEFTPLPVGGAERQAERLSGNLAGRGWNVWVITRSAAGLPNRESRSGFWIIRPSTIGPGKMKSLSFVFGSMVEIWKIRKYFEILHAHLAFGPAFAAVLASLLLGKCVIVKLGNSGQFGDIAVSQKTLRGRFRLYALRHWVDAVIVLDEFMEKEALEAGFPARKVVRMKNGIETKLFELQNTQNQYKAGLGVEDRVVVLSAGRLSAQKSIDFLLSVFSEAVKMNKKLFLMILGDGPDRQLLEHKADLLQLNEYIKFAGHQEDVRPYLFASDIFVLPSQSEGISNSLLEAMAAGLPCLVSDTGGNAEVVDYGSCGTILETGNHSQWTKELLSLSSSEEARRKLGERAKERAKRTYDYAVTGLEMENLYFSLISEKKSAVYHHRSNTSEGGR